MKIVGRLFDHTQSAAAICKSARRQTSASGKRIVDPSGLRIRKDHESQCVGTFCRFPVSLSLQILRRADHVHLIHVCQGGYGDEFLLAGLACRRLDSIHGGGHGSEDESENCD